MGTCKYSYNQLQAIKKIRSLRLNRFFRPRESGHSTIYVHVANRVPQYVVYLSFLFIDQF